jgi:hypothetical protein
VLMCRANAFSIPRYLHAIYTRPLVSAVPVAVLAVVLRATVFPGRGWLELGCAGVIVATSYFGIAFFVVLDATTRRQIVRTAVTVPRLP